MLRRLRRGAVGGSKIRECPPLWPSSPESTVSAPPRFARQAWISRQGQAGSLDEVIGCAQWLWARQSADFLTAWRLSKRLTVLPSFYMNIFQNDISFLAVEQCPALHYLSMTTTVFYSQASPHDVLT